MKVKKEDIIRGPRSQINIHNLILTALFKIAVGIKEELHD